MSMNRKKQAYKVYVNFKNKDEQDRRYALNRKLAGIINLEENGVWRNVMY